MQKSFGHKKEFGLMQLVWSRTYRHADWLIPKLLGWDLKVYELVVRMIQKESGLMPSDARGGAHL